MIDPLTDFIQSNAAHLLTEVTEDTPLFKQGLLDSLLLMKFIAFLERKYRIDIPDEAIVPENFETLRSIRSFLRRIASNG
jgi:acyl carrier protein